MNRRFVTARLTLLLVELFGCETAPAPLPEPEVNLVADIAQMGAELKACLQRENNYLREEKLRLDKEIRSKVSEVEAMLEASERKGKKQP